MVAAVGSTTAVSGTTGTDSSAQIKALERQLASKQKELESAEKDASTTEGARKVRELKAEIAALEARIAQMQAEQKSGAQKTAQSDAQGQTAVANPSATRSASGTAGAYIDVFS